MRRPSPLAPPPGGAAFDELAAGGSPRTLFDHVAEQRDGDGVALVAADADGDRATITYRELVERVAGRRAELALGERSVVAVVGDNSIDWVVTYLALIADRHVPLLVSSHVDRVLARWEPAAVVTTDRHGWSVERFEQIARPELHPELALLMGTSGSTGSPKLVRLSTANLVSNAAAIAEFQGLTERDRAITNLPLHYSMGLSVLHSHLVAGAGVVVTDTSVVDACFARAFAEHDVTNLAGVPHTYELLDQVGPDRLATRSLRFLAQAGGRMDPALVREWVERATAWGAGWFAMYGQTEATARMSFVPPAAVCEHPGVIGRAIPGGTLSIEPVGDAVDGEPGDLEPGDVGEIVYRGPNVMLGYATEAADLAAGRDLTELRTGDLGRVDPASGFVEVVGRTARRIKPFGVRVDLDDVERRLADLGVAARVAGDDDLVVAAPIDEHRSLGDVRDLIVAATGLPARCVIAVAGPPPVTSSGKVDYAAILADGRGRVSGADGGPSSADAVDRMVGVASVVLGRSGVTPDDSFVGLGGDSLSFVECSIRFEQIVGRLPSDWHLRPLSELASPADRRRFTRVDTTVVLRAVGILAVVATHMRLWHVPGGAHLMLGVAGYNVARFLVPIDDAGRRFRAGFRTAARVAIPAVLWTALFMVFAQYTWTTLTFVNNYIGPRSHRENHWHFWFLEVFVHLVVITTLLLAIPAVRRADRRWPYAFPLVLLAAAIALRLDWASLGDWYNMRFRTHSVAWFFVLGWLVQRSSTTPQKIATTVICLVSAPGVFDNPHREFFIAFGLIVLVWANDLPLPRRVVRPLAVLAAASMWIYISHFMIWPPMKQLFVVEVAYPLTILASLGVWWIVTGASRLVAATIARRSDATRRSRTNPRRSNSVRPPTRDTAAPSAPVTIA